MSIVHAYQQMSADELRSEVITLLKEAYADGRIAVDAFERRLKKATNCEAKEDMIGLLSDVPASKAKDSHRPAGAGAGDDEARDWYINPGAPRENQTLFALLGGSKRTGRWQPARNISCYSLMGGIKLDFREAEFPKSGVTINTGSIMGCLEVIVPPGVNIDVSGLPLLGGFEDKAGAGEPGAPTLRVRGMAVMGGVEVKRKNPRSASKSSRRRRERRERRASSQGCTHGRNG